MTEVEGVHHDDVLAPLSATTYPTFQVPQNTYTILQSISKISGPSGLLNWDREVKDCLKQARLWKYTQVQLACWKRHRNW